MARHENPDATPAADPAAEETIVVDREADAETVIVQREADETVVVERADSTVVVHRGAPTDDDLAVTRERPRREPAKPGTGRRRRGMTMPPVAPGFGRGAVDAVGPGAVATYRPRELPPPPAPALEFTGVEATRVEGSGMPSVQRRARRTGLIALGAFVVACVVSVAGLIALGLTLLG